MDLAPSSSNWNWQFQFLNDPSTNN
jgi:hypothetical protein